MWLWRALGGKTPLHFEVEDLGARVRVLREKMESLRRLAGELRHAGLDPDGIAAAKAELLGGWDHLDDEILDMHAAVRAKHYTLPHDEDELREDLAAQFQELNDMLTAGEYARTGISAARHAVPQTQAEEAVPPRFRDAAWLEAVSDLECMETKCRVEYERGEAVCFAEVDRLHGISWADANARSGGGLVGSPGPRGQRSGAAAADATALPAHWGSTARPCWDADDSAVVIDVTDDMYDAVAAMFEGVGDIRSVKRVESTRLWSEFAMKREQLKQYQHELAVGCGRVVAETDLTCNPSAPFPDVLNENVNEKWLFLPCRTEAEADDTVRCGLSRLRKTNGLWGPNLHLYDSAAQADAATGGAQPVMLLCRAALGRVLPCEAPLKTLPEAYSSIVALCRSPTSTLLRPAASTAAWLDKHREFILHATSLAYPAYIVGYRRTPASMAFNVATLS